VVLNFNYRHLFELYRCLIFNITHIYQYIDGKIEMTMRVSNIIRKQIMILGWTFYRTGGYSTFGAALKAAWARERKAQAFARRFMARARANGGVVVFNDLTYSPIRRSLRGQAFADQKAYRAAYTTAVFGR
jgi:hypothetical protein